MTTEHRFLVLDRASLPPRVEVNDLAAAVLNGYGAQGRTVAEYKRMGPLEVTVQKADRQIRSIGLRFDDLVGIMREARIFPFESLGLPKPLSWWLDGSIWATKPDGPLILADGLHAKQLSALGTWRPIEEPRATFFSTSCLNLPR